MIVDAHTHLLPDRLARAIRAFFAVHIVTDLAYPTDVEVVRARLAAEGVDEAWTLPYAHKPGMAAGLNAAMAGIAAADGSPRLVGGATVHPGDDDPAGVVRHAVEELGLRVLKLHCSVGDFSADDRRLDPVWAYASDIALPVVVHAGHSVTGHTEVAELDPIDTVATRWSEARVIVAHCGHRAGNHTLRLLARHPNLHADLTPVVGEQVGLDPALVAPVAGRLLFGSDAPNTQVTVTEALAGLDRLGLDGEALAAVQGRTARRLQADLKV